MNIKELGSKARQSFNSIYTQALVARNFAQEVGNKLKSGEAKAESMPGCLALGAFVFGLALLGAFCIGSVIATE